MIFRVMTAGLEWEGEANDHFDACVQAIKSLKFDRIGLVMRARIKGDQKSGKWVSGMRAFEASGLELAQTGPQNESQS